MNEGVQPLLVLDRFTGVDGTTAAYLLTPTEVVDCTNFLPDQGYAALTTALGRGLIPGFDSALVLPGKCNGVGIFHRYNPFTRTPDVYVFAIDIGNQGTLWAVPVNGTGTLTQIYPSTQSLAPGNLTPGQETYFAEAGVWLFMTNGTDAPLKIDNNLVVTQWGIQPPATAPTLAGGPNGNLTYGGSPYYYCVTFGVTKTSVIQPGQESSQGKISPAFTLGQTPGTGSILFDTSISSLGANYPFQFVLRLGQFQALGPADYPYGATYITQANETAAHVAHQLATNINAAAPIAYSMDSGGGGTLTVTASIAGDNDQKLKISIADSSGDGIDSATYVQYYVDDFLAPGGPFCDPSQTDPANLVGGSTQYKVLLTDIPVSTDAQVTERNIYRLGGSLGQWQLVDTIHDNTTTTYTDTTADNKLTGQALVLYRDPPPPFAFIEAHQQRIFGFNTLNAPLGGAGASNNSSSMWWTNYGEPWGFNELENILTVGESLEGDPGMGLASIGSMLGICKNRGFYGLYGNSDATWQSGLFKIGDTGCSSSRSICRAYGMMGWVSKQGAYVWNGMGLPQNVSDGNAQQSNIKNVFDDSTRDNLKNVTGFWYGRMLGFTFPATGRTYLFDPRSSGWYPLPYFAQYMAYDISSDVPVVGIRNNSTTPVLDAWFLYGTDLGLPVVATLTTRVSGDPDMSWIKDVQYLLVDAPAQSATLQFQIFADSGSNQTVWPPSLLGNGINLAMGLPRHRVSTQLLEAIDVQMQFSLSTTQPGCVINRIGLYGVLNRQFGPESQSDQ